MPFMLEGAKCPMLTYSAAGGDAKLKAENVRLTGEGVHFEAVYGAERVQTELAIPGMFSVYNALGIIAAAQGFGAVGIYWHDKAAIVHTDTRGGKATWLCVQPGVYPSTTYNKFVLPTIEQGCEGAANRAATVMLQRLLGIPHDGSFGPATTKALMTAQRKHGLVPDGICGPKSWTALSGADKYL